MKIDWHSSEFVIAAPTNPRVEKLAQFAKSHRNISDHVFLASSGTSSSSSETTKWVALSKQAILKSAAAVNDHTYLSKKDIILAAIPNTHIGGLALYARAYLSGAKIIDWRAQNPKWGVGEFYTALVDSGATMLSLVPTQVYDLVRAEYQPPKTVRAVIIGGAALSPDLYSSARRLGWPLLPSLGMTEAASQIATASLQSLKNPNEYPELELLPHITAKTDSQKNLSIKSSALFSGYVFQNAEGLCEFYSPVVDGWFSTSDFAEIKGNTIVHLGRASDLIKIAGELVSTFELEKTFGKLLYSCRALLGPLDSMTLAFIPDTRLGSSVALFVEERSADPDLIRSLVNEFNSQVRPFEKIRTVKVVKELPKTELGKIIKPQLASLQYQTLEL